MKLKKETACSLFYSNKTWNHQRLSCVLTLFLGPPPSLCCLQLSYVVAHVCYGKSQGAGTGACEQGTSVSHTPLTYGEHFRSGSVVGCACMCVTVVYQYDSLPSLCCRLPGSLVTEGERRGEKTLDVSDASGDPVCITCKNFASYPSICHMQYQCHSQTFSLMFQLSLGMRLIQYYHWGASSRHLGEKT